MSGYITLNYSPVRWMPLLVPQLGEVRAVGKKSVKWAGSAYHEAVKMETK